MLIALDYDGTYTLDPSAWQKFIDSFAHQGHDIICVTMRFESELENVCQTLKKKVKIICTGRKAKKGFLERMNIHPDIWIDDNPEWLFKDAFVAEDNIHA